MWIAGYQAGAVQAGSVSLPPLWSTGLLQALGQHSSTLVTTKLSAGQGFTHYTSVVNVQNWFSYLQCSSLTLTSAAPGGVKRLSLHLLSNRYQTEPSKQMSSWDAGREILPLCSKEKWPQLQGLKHLPQLLITPIRCQTSFLHLHSSLLPVHPILPPFPAVTEATDNIFQQANHFAGG